MNKLINVMLAATLTMASMGATAGFLSQEMMNNAKLNQSQGVSSAYETEKSNIENNCTKIEQLYDDGETLSENALIAYAMYCQ